MKFQAGDQVLWYGEIAEVKAVRGDSVWIALGGIDHVVGLADLVKQQRPHDLRRRSLLAPRV